MRALIFAVAIIIGSSVALSSQQSSQKKIPESIAPKARILQLESQIVDLQTQNAILTARLAVAIQTLSKYEQGKNQNAIELEANCEINWEKDPPACKDDPK